MDWVTKQKALQDFVVSCTGLAEDHVYWAQQQGPRPTQPAIKMRLHVPQDESSPWLDREVNYLSFNDIVVTSVDDTANTFTKTAHGLLTGDGPVELVGSDLPLNTAEDTSYWVIKVDDNTFKLADGFVNSKNGVAIDLGDTGSGAITLVDTAVTLRATEELVYKARNILKLILTLECFAATGTGTDMAVAILHRIEAKRALPSKVAILEAADIAIADIGRILSIDGVQDVYLYEPRAITDIILNTVSEEEEYGTIIERTEITDEGNANTFTVDVEDPPPGA